MTEFVETADAGVRSARFDRGEWLIECRLLELDGGTLDQRSPDAESLLVVLAGTHDLYAGGGSWLRRGLRPAPTGGRPVALFLPPHTPYRLDGGNGRAIVWSARQPEPPAPKDPKQVLSEKPLLPIAGSGKAFDPETGTWKPQEAFRSSPEAILPRRIARVDVGGVELQRILDTDYKALGLGVDELTLRDGRSATPPALAGGWAPAEVGVYYETDGLLEIDGDEVEGRGVLQLDAVPQLRAARGAAYVSLAYAGPKPTT